MSAEIARLRSRERQLMAAAAAATDPNKRQAIQQLLEGTRAALASAEEMADVRREMRLHA